MAWPALVQAPALARHDLDAMAHWLRWSPRATHLMDVLGWPGAVRAQVTGEFASSFPDLRGMPDGLALWARLASHTVEPRRLDPRKRNVLAERFVSSTDADSRARVRRWLEHPLASTRAKHASRHATQRTLVFSFGPWNTLRGDPLLEQDALLCLAWNLSLTREPTGPFGARVHVDVTLADYLRRDAAPRNCELQLRAALLASFTTVLNHLVGTLNAREAVRQQELWDDAGDDAWVETVDALLGEPGAQCLAWAETDTACADAQQWPVALTLRVPAGHGAFAVQTLSMLQTAWLHSPRLSSTEELDFGALRIVGSEVEEAQPAAVRRRAQPATAVRPGKAPAQQLIVIEQVASELYLDATRTRVLTAHQVAWCEDWEQFCGLSPYELLEQFGLQGARPDTRGWRLDQPFRDEFETVVQWLADRLERPNLRALRFDVVRAAMFAHTVELRDEHPLVRVLVDAGTGVMHAELLLAGSRTWTQTLDAHRASTGRALPGFVPQEVLVARNLLHAAPEIGRWCKAQDVAVVHPKSGFDSGLAHARRVRKNLELRAAREGYALSDVAGALTAWAALNAELLLRHAPLPAEDPDGALARRMALGAGLLPGLQWAPQWRPAELYAALGATPDLEALRPAHIQALRKVYADDDDLCATEQPDTAPAFPSGDDAPSSDSH
jgi:hypothetical protein